MKQGLSIFDMDQLDPIPSKDGTGQYRRVQVAAVATLIRLGALDLLPVLFAPVVGRAPTRGVRS